MEKNELKENNLKFWNEYKQVPSNALRNFDNGRFKGTDINTMWRLKSLTEAFGMVGFGWYYNLKRTWVETTQNSEQFAFAEIELFVKVDGEWSKPIVGTGGNKITSVKKDGTYMTSDEAFKMAITDAIGVACRSLGMGADVYWENDRTKYTEANKQHKEEVKIKLVKGIQPNAGTITKEQLETIKEMGLNVDGICAFVEVPSLDMLSAEQAQWVIDSKRK